ncbi:MAG: ABC transporter permease [Lachnospiraceae bacterium]
MKGKKKVLSSVYMVLVYLFLFIPILAVVVGSVNANSRSAGFDGFTLQWYAELVESQSLLSGLQNTVILAVSSTILSVMIGTLAAFGMYRFKFKGKGILDTMFYIPIVVPEIVLGISLMVIFSMMNITAGMITLLIAHTTFCIPYVVFNVRASIAGLDPSLEEASMDLGRNRLQTFLHITLPLIMPGITSGAFMAFTLSIDDVIISYFTSGPGTQTLPIVVYNMTRKRITPDVYALSTLIILIATIIMVITQINFKKFKKEK